MSEQLLTLEETVKRLGVSRMTFYRHLPRLRARGLQLVRFGKRPMFREASLDRIIKKAAEEESAL